MIVIVGAGGHGQVVADIFRARRVAGLASATTGFLDDDPSRQGLALAGGVVFGPVSSLDQIDRLGTVVAIGDNRTRARVHQRLAAAGEIFAVAEHPRSVVADDVEIGDGSMVCAGAIVSTGTVIGHNTIVNTGATVDHHSTIGNHVHIGPGVHMGGEVRVDEGALIGIGATVIPGIHIGAWSTVGAGAVVIRDVAPGTTVVGCPAKPIAAAVTA
jgi:sugar O-acyltransferase (sialic acid O-acetyltransferase NeuD family)